MAGMAVDLIRLAGSGTGEATFDLSRLLPAVGTRDSHVEVSMAMNIGSQKQKMTMKMDENVRIEAK